MATASTHLSTATRSSSARRAPREGGDHWVELERPALKQLIVFAIRVGMLQEAPIDPGFTHAFSERRILCAMERDILSQIINLENPSVWPGDLVAYLEEHIDLFLGWERQGRDAAVSAQDFGRAIDGLGNVLKAYALIGWHCTCLTEEEIAAIIAQGMTPPDAQFLGARIAALHQAGVIARDDAAKLRAKNQAHESNRAGRIWFWFFPPHIAGERGIGRFFRSWGGEALYNSHEGDPQTGPILAGIGIPCLVEAEVPIASLPSVVRLASNIYSRFLVSRGHHSSKPMDHQDRATRPLPRERIRRIIRFPELDFIRLTKCDEWRVPLPQS